MYITGQYEYVICTYVYYYIIDGNKFTQVLYNIHTRFIFSDNESSCKIVYSLIILWEKRRKNVLFSFTENVIKNCFSHIVINISSRILGQ